MTRPPLLVLHDIGDEDGGRPWADAFASVGWDGAVLAPSLPGHGGAPPPEGGNHEPSDSAYAIVPQLTRLDDPRPVVVGVGVNGWTASLCGLGGRASAVVLVDGTGAPWTTPTEFVHRQRDWLRAIADDPAALAPAPARGLDPRLRHGLPAHGSRRLAAKAAAALHVPLLLRESPASGCPMADAIGLASSCPGGGRVIDVADRSPKTVAAAVVSWLD